MLAGGVLAYGLAALAGGYFWGQARVITVHTQAQAAWVTERDSWTQRLTSVSVELGASQTRITVLEEKNRTLAQELVTARSLQVTITRSYDSTLAALAAAAPAACGEPLQQAARACELRVQAGESVLALEEQRHANTQTQLQEVTRQRDSLTLVVKEQRILLARAPVVTKTGAPFLGLFSSPGAQAGLGCMISSDPTCGLYVGVGMSIGRKRKGT